MLPSYHAMQVRNDRDKRESFMAAYYVEIDLAGCA